MAAELRTEVAWKLHHTASFSGAMLCFQVLHNCQEKKSEYFFLNLIPLNYLFFYAMVNPSNTQFAAVMVIL